MSGFTVLVAGLVTYIMGYLHRDRRAKEERLPKARAIAAYALLQSPGIPFKEEMKARALIAQYEKDERLESDVLSKLEEVRNKIGAAADKGERELRLYGFCPFSDRRLAEAIVKRLKKDNFSVSLDRGYKEYHLEVKW